MENEAHGAAAASDEVSRTLAAIAERSQKIVTEFLDRQAGDPAIAAVFDPLYIGDAFLQMTAQLLASPVTLVEAQMSLWNNYLHLWQSTARSLLTIPAPPGDAEMPPVAPTARWQEAEVFDFIKQSTLLTARWVQSLVKAMHGLDDDSLRKADFYTRQFIDAMSPSGFFGNNPDFLSRTADHQGENLVRGLDRMLADLERGKDRLAERWPMAAIAGTPGQVICRNRVMELLHYAPGTEPSRKTPLLLLPSWTHKSYIFDLDGGQSLIKWAVDQGHSVFLLSWADGDPALDDQDIADSLTQGPIAALDAIRDSTGERQVNAVGFGLGGTLLAVVMAWLAARGENRFKSASLFGSLLDFSQVGALSVFIDEEQLRQLDQPDDSLGLGDDAMLALLRANDLIWSFVVDNCRLDQDPFPFDLLAWNADLPRPAKALQRFYLHSLYQQNLLATPGGLTMAGTAIDLGRVDVPCYVVAAAEDHIAPWQSVLAGARLLGGPIDFVRAGSGHATGLIHPPHSGRHGYWRNDQAGAEPQGWLAGAERHPGSWWRDWGSWLAAR